MSKKKALICIIGRSASGKDTAAKYLVNEKNLRAVCSYATRAKRDNETEGVEHYFISDEEMKEILETKKIAAYTKIEDPNSGVKGYEYCATVDEVRQSDIYVIDPIGFEKLKEELKDENDIVTFVIYCYSSYDTRKQRIIDSGRGEEALQAFEDRHNNEDTQFTEFEKAFPPYNSEENYYYMIDNERNQRDFINDIRFVYLKIQSTMRRLRRE